MAYVQTMNPRVFPGPIEEDAKALDTAVSVVIPAFNEAAHVAAQIQAVRNVMELTGWDFEIIVVDDGSSDGTALRALETGVRVLQNRRNRGYGASLKRGIAASSTFTLAPSARTLMASRFRSTNAWSWASAR